MQVSLNAFNRWMQRDKGWYFAIGSSRLLVFLSPIQKQLVSLMRFSSCCSWKVNYSWSDYHNNAILFHLEWPVMKLYYTVNKLNTLKLKRPLTRWGHLSGISRQMNIPVLDKCRGCPDRPLSPLRSSVGHLPTNSTCAISCRVCILHFLCLQQML